MPVCIGFYNDYMVFRHGSIVTVTLLQVPPCNTSSKSWGDVTFIYNGEKYHTKSIGNNCDSFKPGGQAKLKHLKGYGIGFIFLDEDPLLIGWTLIIIILLAGAGFMYYAFKQS